MAAGAAPWPRGGPGPARGRSLDVQLPRHQHGGALDQRAHGAACHDICDPHGDCRHVEARDCGGPLLPGGAPGKRRGRAVAIPPGRLDCLRRNRPCRGPACDGRAANLALLCRAGGVSRAPAADGCVLAGQRPFVLSAFACAAAGEQHRVRGSCGDVGRHCRTRDIRGFGGTSPSRFHRASGRRIRRDLARGHVRADGVRAGTRAFMPCCRRWAQPLPRERLPRPH